MAEFLQNDFSVIALWLVGAVMCLYVILAFMAYLSIGRLFWQNIFNSNKVQLPRLAKKVAVPSSGAEDEESQALVLVRSLEGPGPSERGGIIYPAIGRNGLNFKPDHCTSCGLCEFVCPASAITVEPLKEDYLRKFDLGSCIYCGLCESACPTTAIHLTVEPHALRNELHQLVISGKVSFKTCPKCGAKVPEPDLLAGRIYQVESEQDEPGQAWGSAALFNLEPCPECIRRVLKAEEAICD